MKRKQLRQGFELGSTIPFPSITMTLNALFVNKTIYLQFPKEIKFLFEVISP